ncbi:MAG: hypothetical protein QF718_04695 [Phycisphaerales bacterium]|nr:hypothetical protein [Phycisphaerales bacterium]
MSKKKGMDLDIQKILAWCKSNIVLVILAVVCIGVIIGLPRVAATWNEEVQSNLKKRSSYFAQLDKLTNTTITLPGSTETTTVVVNQALVKDYTEVSNSLIGDAQEVVKLANDLNHKNYEVIFSGELFPAPTQAQKETLPQRFYKQLESEYKALLGYVNAGVPLSNEELATYLEDLRVRYMETNLSTRHDADLTSEQRSSLEKYLSKQRISRLRSQSEDISIYFDESTLNIPSFDLTAMPSIGELFNWQWRFWAVADIVGSIGVINDNQSVLTSPIKRIISMEVLGLPEVEDESDASGRGGSSGGKSGGSGASGPPKSGPPRPGPSPFGPGGRPKPKPKPSPSGSGKPSRGNDSGQLSPSFTGRTSGQMYDLLQVQLSMVVDSQRIPYVLDGLASYNFYTVIDIDLQPEDKFLALGDGFDYGAASVSELTVILEIVWLRSWTTEFMPNSIKKSLGINVDE